MRRMVHLLCVAFMSVSLLPSGNSRASSLFISSLAVGFILVCRWHSVKGLPSGSVVGSLPAVLEMQVRSLGREDPREANGNPLQYFYLGNLLDRGAWLQSTGSQRVRYDLATEQQQRK